MNTGERPEIVVADLGYIGYVRAWKLQEYLMQQATAVKLWNRDHPPPEQKQTRHFLLLCEHNPVYTLGKSGRLDHLLWKEEELLRKGIEVYRINRGGDITYHGPGQITGYPILDLEFFFTDLHRYMRYLEEFIIKTLSEYGIQAGRIPGLTGVWVGHQDERNARKICAFGVHMSRWITMHGFALNVNPRLDMFGGIVPCGLRDRGVTSMALELGVVPDFTEVKNRLIQNFAAQFHATYRVLPPGEIADMLEKAEEISLPVLPLASPDAPRGHTKTEAAHR